MAVGVGIDVSSKKLDCRSVGDKSSEGVFKNDSADIECLKQWLEGLGPADEIRIVLEPTSSYHRAVSRVLRKAGYDVRLINPRQARDLAKGLGRRLKNDRVDALTLAECAIHDVVKAIPSRDELHDRYRDISRQIQDLTDEMANAKKKAQTPELGKEALASVKRVIEFYKKEIQKLEKLALSLAKKHADLKECLELAMTVPRVGIKTARAIVAEIVLDPEFLDPQKVCSYASVVPQENSSGDMKNKSSIGRVGNARLRKSLYMPATLLAFCDGDGKDIYQRLKQRGFSHNQAIVVLMHKLLRTVVAVLKRRSPWVAHP